VANKETKTCHACRKTLNSDWEVCPFCGAQQESFELADEPRAPGETIEYEPAENEQVERSAPGPIRAVRLRPGSIPTDTAPYAVMRLASGRINVSRVGRLLADILGRPLADITCRMQASKGFLAREVPQAKLADVARSLDTLGIEAIVVRECDVAPLPPQYRTAQVTQSDGDLVCAATSQNDKTWKLTFAPRQVRFIVTGRAMYSARVTIDRAAHDRFANVALLKKRHLDPNQDAHKEIHGYDYLVGVFLCRPERLLLIANLDIDYDKMERRAANPMIMARQARLLMEAIDASLHDDALRLLADLVEEDDPAWLPYTFATLKGIEAYAHWRYNAGLIED